MDQSGLEQSRQIMSSSVLTAQLPHGVHMVYSWTMHGHQNRSNYQQHGPCVTYINRVAIQQRLLVEFSYDPHINSLLKALLACVIIGLCVQWLPQHLALSPILLALYLSLLFYIFEKCVKNLKILVSFLSFIINGLLISQEKSFEKTNLFLFCSYNIVSSLLD